jgi:hypothetical protein
VQQDPGSALSDLVRSAGPEGLDDARRVRAMLRDAAPEARLEVSLLVAAVEEGVGQRLARSSGGLLGGEIERLAADLVARRGLSPGNADWAVRTLSWAVGRSPRPAPLVVEAGGPARGRSDSGPGRVLTHPGGGWEPPRSDPGGLPASWVMDGGPQRDAPGGAPPGGGGIGGGPGEVPATPPAWWQRVPVIIGITAGIVVLLIVVVTVVLAQRSGSDDTTADGGTTGDGGTSDGGTSDGGGTSEGGGTSGDGGSTGDGGGTGGDVSVGTGVYPDARELVLLSLLDEEYGGSTCQRWAGPEDSPLYMHRPLAAILCTPSAAAADVAVFVQYGSDAESEMTFDAVFPDLTGGDCVQDAPMASTYDQGEEVDAGYFGCLIDDDGTAYVVWTRTGRGVYAYGSSDSSGLDALFDWFLTRTNID